ncbi:hypothetical protein [Streptosporangium sp. KLBMP 9127]|nr:hypothetical protein [Streptosporangium sp. KLBMP 9127]
MTRARVVVSPFIPFVAVLLLAALWGFSVFAGWGLAAFCADGELARDCTARLRSVSTFSGVFAVVGACCTAVAWVRPTRRWSMPFMIAAVVAWVLAEAVLFVGGMLVR